MIKIGMMIGDRYEILEKIGTGGMSDVYKAKCHKLNRFVAVKVLKQEFSENANFVSKFRVEAQAAAGLMHPNIVNVYDVGEENGIYYIVMELVEGITLKKYIEKKARLSYKEAVSIGIQVALGIEAAHNNHIIHRDIKPQNIIISKDGKVKVTDFGIAKAATSNTITSNVMGSVHYTSPEQARGGYSDEKSDIYSLGVTMFEMLTGRVPFNGETTVAIAIKHIQEEMPSPKEYVPEIPSSVEKIVLKCSQKSPDRRYQSMAEVIADLKQSLVNPEGDFVVLEDPDTEGITRMISDSDTGQIKMASSGQNMRLLRNTEELPAANEEDEIWDEGPDAYDYDPKVERVTTILVIVLGVVVCAFVLFMLFRVFRVVGNEEGKKGSVVVSEESSSGEAEKGEIVLLPDLSDMDIADARKILESAGFICTVTYEESDTYAEDIVIRTEPAADTRVETGSSIKLIVSSGASAISVPAVTGMVREAGVNALSSAGFEVILTENYSESVAAGYIISQNPEGNTQAPAGAVITLTISLGKPDSNKVAVPNVIGMTEEDATITIIEAGLKLANVSYIYSDEIEEGKVCYQSVPYNSYLNAGDTVSIRISQGPEAVVYKYNGSIAAPTAGEAPDYVSGAEVAVKLVTDSGSILMDTKTTTFPLSANFYGLNASGGTITFTYTVTTPATTTTDPVTGESVTTPGSTQEKSFSRRVEFVRS